MRVMISGSREWTNTALLLDNVARFVPADATIVVGDAAGVDAMVRQFWPPAQTEVFTADWDRFGRAAGPLRNQAMVATGPNLLLAFPLECSLERCSGRAKHWTHGTWDAIRRARYHGVAVTVISDDDTMLG